MAFAIFILIIFPLEPSDSPQDITVETTSPTRIKVNWNPVPAGHRNGIIEGYKIIYRALPSGSNITKTINGNNEQQQQQQQQQTTLTTLYHLNEFTNYSIRILAFTSKGDGPLSAAKVIETKEDSKFLIKILVCIADEQTHGIGLWTSICETVTKSLLCPLHI